VQICEHGWDCFFCCWPWQAGKFPAGYGHFCFTIDGEKQDIPAQRMAWELWNKRPFPKDLQGLHHCDFPPCCNPDHVRPGTPWDNQQDVIRRGRRADTKGERSSRAKLTAKEVIEIRQRYANGEKKYQLAKAFHVSRFNIHLIVRRRNWSHIP
jgi:hypothetical protein